MRDKIGTTKSGQEYAAAYAMHYVEKDLHQALDLYDALIVAHPDTPEAGYSRSQVNNIVKAVVPAHEFLDAQLKLAHAHFALEEAR